MRAVIPPIRPILSIFDHTIFPIHISHCPFLIDTTVVINSGREVPIAMIVSPMILSDNQINPAIDTAPFTAILLPRIKAVNHHATISISFR